MVEDQLLTLLDDLLCPLGSETIEGEQYLRPALSVLRFYARKVKLGRAPILGRAWSVVAVVRQPVDLAFTAGGNRSLLERVSAIANERFPPWPRGWALSMGLTTIALTPEPIGPGDDALLRSSLSLPARYRGVPLGLIRLNLGQEAMAQAIAAGPEQLFVEPATLIDALAKSFRRYVPLVQG
jgi:hypothetical protein